MEKEGKLTVTEAPQQFWFGFSVQTPAFTLTLPAGEYLSLRLIIGEGKGHNWWCVVYPPLCQSVSQEDFTGAAEEAGLTEEEVSLISGESRGYAVRFKSMEWVENLLASFS